MKKFINRLTRKQIIWGSCGLLVLCVALILHAISSGITGNLETQNAAARWSDKNNVSQVSCFFSRESNVSEDTIITFEHQLDKALEEASIVSESENSNARLWVDAYSAGGEINVASDRTNITVKAVGIGGDFFFFHPMKLLKGSYFSGNDVLQDYIILDEDAAWQLFGSNDVVGQIVTIQDVPHIVTGVIKRESGKMAEQAGLSASVAYVSYETLNSYGTDYGINTFELVMPNPVSGYAKQYVSENIGMDSNELEVVENSTRFDISNKFKLIAQFGSRSMSSKAIIYPFWENIARGYEDILGLLFIITVLLLLFPVTLVIIAIVIAWKHKKWTGKSVYYKLQDKWQRFLEKRREERKAKKNKINPEKSGKK